MTTLLDKVAGLSTFRAMLVGDFMLDEIVHGAHCPLNCLKVFCKSVRPLTRLHKCSG